MIKKYLQSAWLKNRKKIIHGPKPINVKFKNVRDSEEMQNF